MGATYRPMESQEQALELIMAEINGQRDRIKALETTLEWYAENTRLCRLIHSEGDPGRNALSEDGGARARNALDSGLFKEA